ncbi:MAG TPA: hypothetical protein VGJ29_09440, partial [Vicinamibacterales bacterium]
LFSSASVIIGVLWDISWHRTIGRDTFWTPPHLAIYIGGVVAGLTCGWLALRTTFAAAAPGGPGSNVEKAASVRFWGFRAPLGAWICIWGAFAMLTSAPFDDWWHNAYGLDVKILSPPHALLALGIAAIQVGAMLIALAWQNRATGSRASLSRLVLFAAGLMLINAATIASEHLQRWDMHQAIFYEVAAGVFPFFLVSGARASVARWPATIIALLYMAVTWVLLVALPLVPAHPMLGPIYVQIDHLMPPDFPLLLIVPAVCIDVAMHRVRGHDWRLSLIVAVLFVLAFIAAEWPFANALMTHWARNWAFATDRMPYYADLEAQRRWYTLNTPEGFTVGIPAAMALAFASTRCGLWWGSWMARVQR